MKKLIAANWKMNKTASEAVSTVKELKALVRESGNADIVLCPPSTALHAVSKELTGSNIKLGAQNMHFELSGAYTGEISPIMLKEIGCEFVILGHSERREFFHEDDSFINRKVISALKNGLNPLLCIGESLEQRQKQQTEDVLEGQLTKCLEGISDIRNVSIAYEPVWAISRGDPNKKAATASDAEQAHFFIRKVLSGAYGKPSEGTRILYGGSMKPENAKELLALPNIDGGLIGNASLNAKSFFDIIKSA